RRASSPRTPSSASSDVCGAAGSWIAARTRTPAAEWRTSPGGGTPQPPPPRPTGATPPALPPAVVPARSAVVMHGNGRGGNQRGLARPGGHTRGEAALLDVVAGAIEIGVSHISAYAFSTENWKRSPDEVRFLMGFNRDVIRRRRDQMHE